MNRFTQTILATIIGGIVTFLVVQEIKRQRAGI